MKKTGILFFALILLLSSCSTMVNDFKKADTSFSVVEYYESLNNSGFDPDLTVTYDTKGNPDRFIEIKKDGFELVNHSFENGLLTLEYNRKKITINFHPEGGIWGLSTRTYSQTGKYGENLPRLDVLNLTKAGYKFIGWSLSPNGQLITLPDTYPANDLDYYAVWDSNVSTYIVEIYEENIEDDNYTLVSTEVYPGNPGEKINFVPRSKNGFYSLEYDKDTVIGPKDEPPVRVELKYKRKLVEYSFDLGYLGLIKENHRVLWKSNTSEIKVLRGKFGQPYTSCENVSELKFDMEQEINEGEESEIWIFEGWNEVGGKPATIMTEDHDYNAIWRKLSSTYYTVKHLFESADDETVFEGLPEYPDEKINGIAGELTKAVPYNPSGLGFMALPVEQKIIEEGTETVVEIKYVRAQVSITLNANGGYFNDDETNQSIIISGKSGTTIPAEKIPENPKKEFNSFVIWSSPLPHKFPAADQRFDAVWKRDGAVYSVEYYFEEADSDSYVKDVSYSASYVERLNTPVNYEPSIIEGFELHHVEGENCSYSNGIARISSIKADDSTVVKLFYNRVRIRVTFDPNAFIFNPGTEWNGLTVDADGHSFDGDTEKRRMPRTVELKYGQTFADPRYTLHSEDGRYNFVGWDPEYLGSVPLAQKNESGKREITYLALHEEIGTEYLIRYWFESLDGTGREVDGIHYKTDENYEDKKAYLLSGETTDVHAEIIPGFTLKEIEQKIVTEDTVVDVFYNRKDITLQFKANSQQMIGDAHFDDGNVNKTSSGKFGADFDMSKIGSPSKPFARFLGWVLEADKDKSLQEKKERLVTIGATYPAQDMIYFAVWEDLETTEQSGSLIDPSVKDLKLKATPTGVKNQYEVSIEQLPFEGNWKFDWCIGQGTWSGPGSQSSKLFTVTYGKNTIKVIARCEGFDIPFNAKITLDIEQ